MLGNVCKLYSNFSFFLDDFQLYSLLKCGTVSPFCSDENLCPRMPDII